MQFDAETYLECNPKDRWIFNKLEIALIQGIAAGTNSHEVPATGYYIVRPIINLHGMGVSATKEWIEEGDEEEKVPDGFFWMEMLQGRHLSIDYENKKPVLVVEGFKADTLYKWNKWVRKSIKSAIKLPKFLRRAGSRNKYLNVEFIGGRVIEVHLRGNPDFEESYNEIIPVWDDTTIEFFTDRVEEGYSFVEAKEYNGFETRHGFLVR